MCEWPQVTVSPGQLRKKARGRFFLSDENTPPLWWGRVANGHARW